MCVWALVWLHRAGQCRKSWLPPPSLHSPRPIQGKDVSRTWLTGDRPKCLRHHMFHTNPGMCVFRMLCYFKVVSHISCNHRLSLPSSVSLHFPSCSTLFYFLLFSPELLVAVAVDLKTRGDLFHIYILDMTAGHALQSVWLCVAVCVYVGQAAEEAVVGVSCSWSSEDR